MKVLLIDPWGIANTSEYLNGLISGLDKGVSLTVYTNYHFKIKVDANPEVQYVFFKKSEKMRRGVLRTIMRGIEYSFGYQRIIRRLKKETFDVVHINWLLYYNLDILFLKKIKKYTDKLVYTAHNVIPHERGEKYLDQLNHIYELCDKIVLHGYSIKDEFIRYFPKYEEKIYIQKHGSNLLPKTQYEIERVPHIIREKIESFNKVAIYFGLIFFNKGVDRIVKCWDPKWEDSLLIVAGKQSSENNELDALKEKMQSQANILELNCYVDENVLNYMISKSDFVVLPYRHASMSGVVFTAADFAKTILVTDTGAIKEYLEPSTDSFVVKNEDTAIEEAVRIALFETTKESLELMGQRLRNNIYEKCSWERVAQKLIEDCYMK